MKKIHICGITILVLLTALMTACSGTPKAPVNTLVKLDKLALNGMTPDQVMALAQVNLTDSAVLYKAGNIAQSSGGDWIVTGIQGGYAAQDTTDYQVLIFQPEKKGGNYYVVYFKANLSIGKTWFDSAGGASLESLLKGTLISK